MSNLKVNSINDASGGSTAVLYGVAAPTNSMGFRNRIINGDMRIDQRNAGASVTINAANIYCVDRIPLNASGGGVFSAQQSSTAPAGFTNSIALTVTTPDSSIGAVDNYWLGQKIEGYNVSDLGWGTASALPVTLTFWVRSSVTGTYSGTLNNNAYDRSYIFTYTINSANTWEQKTVVVPGDTTGTWLKTNGIGMYVIWSLGCGSTYSSSTAGAWLASGVQNFTGAVNWIATSGATFYITGVQLEAGSVASPFERRDYGRELMMCKRYYEVIGYRMQISGNYASGTWQVTKRASPTMTISGTGTVAVVSGLETTTFVLTAYAATSYNATVAGTSEL